MAHSALVDCACLLSLPAHEEERLDLDAHPLRSVLPVIRQGCSGEKGQARPTGRRLRGHRQAMVPVRPPLEAGVA